MSLRRKLLLTFVALLLLVGLQAGVAVALLTQVAEGSAQLVRPALGRVDTLAHLEADALRLHVLQHTLLEDGVGLGDSDERARAEMADLRVRIRDLLQQYGSQALDTRRRAVLDDIQRQYADLVQVQTHVDSLAQQGDYAEAVKEYRQAEPTFVALDDGLHLIRHLEYADVEQARNQLAATAEWSRWPLGIAVVAVAAAELALGWSLWRGIIGSLTMLRDGARRILSESNAEPVPAPPEPEFAELATTLNTVTHELAENRAAHARLEAERLQLLQDRLGQVVRAQEEERARVSRELHDQAGQALTALKYGLNHLARVYREPGASHEVAQLAELATLAGQQIGALARDLRPAVLDDLGLLAALRGYAREYAERVGIAVAVSAPQPIPRLAPDAETAVFRVVQEALTNVAKHARASHAWIDLSWRTQQLDVRVRDDGRGFDPSTVASGQRRGLGLAGIQERVQLLGGSFELWSQPGQGTTLSISIPASVALRPDPPSPPPPHEREVVLV
ncbi:MAG TPA: ATP-binding protein [Chloroflexota bacterium]